MPGNDVLWLQAAATHYSVAVSVGVRSTQVAVTPRRCNEDQASTPLPYGCLTSQVLSDDGVTTTYRSGCLAATDPAATLGIRFDWTE